MKKDLHIDLDEDQGTGAVITSGTSTDVIEEGGTKAVIIDEDGDETDKLPSRAIRNDDGSVTLPLIEPVTITTRKDGKVRERAFESLTFYRLKGADIHAIAAASKENDTVVTFARSTRTMQAVMNAVFDKMDAADIVDGSRVINHFLTSGRKTGR
ncbi:MAG: hypothetical protein ACK40W_02055 [Allorhizobium sp.]